MTGCGLLTSCLLYIDHAYLLWDNRSIARGIKDFPRAGPQSTLPCLDFSESFTFQHHVVSSPKSRIRCVKYLHHLSKSAYSSPILTVRLGKSGLKVSKIILGCMSYGSSKWAGWIIDDEEEATKHIKFAYDHGIQTFDTANVGLYSVLDHICLTLG